MNLQMSRLSQLCMNLDLGNNPMKNLFYLKEVSFWFGCCPSPMSQPETNYRRFELQQNSKMDINKFDDNKINVNVSYVLIQPPPPSIKETSIIKLYCKFNKKAIFFQLNKHPAESANLTRVLISNKTKTVLLV